MIIKSPQSSVDSSFLAKMLYPSLFSSLGFEKKVGAKEVKGILKDIDSRIEILSRIISCGSDGFKNAKCSEKDLLFIYNEIINNSKYSKLSSAKKQKDWISKCLKSNFEEESLNPLKKSAAMLSSGSSSESVNKKSPSHLSKTGKENLCQ